MSAKFRPAADHACPPIGGRPQSLGRNQVHMRLASVGTEDSHEALARARALPWGPRIVGLPRRTAASVWTFVVKLPKGEAERLARVRARLTVPERERDPSVPRRPQRAARVPEQPTAEGAGP